MHILQQEYSFIEDNFLKIRITKLFLIFFKFVKKHRQQIIPLEDNVSLLIGSIADVVLVCRLLLASITTCFVEQPNLYDRRTIRQRLADIGCRCKAPQLQFYVLLTFSMNSNGYYVRKQDVAARYPRPKLEIKSGTYHF